MVQLVSVSPAFACCCGYCGVFPSAKMICLEQTLCCFQKCVCFTCAKEGFVCAEGKDYLSCKNFTCCKDAESCCCLASTLASSEPRLHRGTARPMTRADSDDKAPAQLHSSLGRKRLTSPSPLWQMCASSPARLARPK